jgi:ABC-2 type transport system permease protein
MPMNALHIAVKDLETLFRDRGTAIQLLGLPLIFVLVFSGALQALTAGRQDSRVPLAVIDEDEGSLAQTLRDAIDASGGIYVVPTERAAAEAALDKGELARALFIPPGFSADVAAGRSTALRLISRPDAHGPRTEAVRLVVEGVARDMALESQVLLSLEQMGEMTDTVPDAFATLAVEEGPEQARAQFAAARDRPLVSLTTRVPERAVAAEETASPAQLSVPSFTVLFVFLTAQATARSIYDEKRVGSFRRLLAAPISKTELLVGKMLPNVIASLIQVVVIFSFGMLVLPLLGQPAFSLGNAPFAVALVALLMALCSSGLGILIAALARTEHQIGGLSAVILWAMGMVGGSFIPIFYLERFLGRLMRVVPHYWANSAFTDLLVRGAGLRDVVPQMIALLVFTVAFFAVGVWKFEFD